MRLFKSVEVSSSAVSGGAAVAVKVEDGRYIIPLPFLMGGAGGSRGGLFVVARNNFRQAETLTAYGFASRIGSRLGAGARWEDWSVDASYEKRDLTERLYADGAYSASSGFEEPPDQRTISKYGPVADSYDKSLEAAKLTLGAPLWRWPDYLPRAAAVFGWGYDQVGYASPAPSAPADAGRQGEAFAGVQFGPSIAPGGDSLGALLRFGLADLQYRIRPLPRPVVLGHGGLLYHRGAAWTGSDFSYGYAAARWTESVSWGSHRTLALTVAGANGDDLPANRLLHTGPETAFQGQYAREFRGDAAFGADLTYSHPFRITRRGIWQGTLFAETARVRSGGRSFDKQGLGTSFFYRFWRFPLPLGVSFTYSLDDKDLQTTGAIGGRF